MSILIHHSTLSTSNYDPEMLNCKIALRCCIKKLKMGEKTKVKTSYLYLVSYI